MSGRKNNVVSLADMTAKKLDKELELEFYRKHLASCERRLSLIQADINVTLEIINMIENEKIVLVDVSLPLINIDDDENNLE